MCSPRRGLGIPFHPSLQDDRGTHLIHQGFVAACHFADATLQDGLLSQYAGIAFVPHIDRHRRECLLQLRHEGLHSGQVLAVTPVRLLGQSYHKALHRFLREVILQERQQLGCLDSGQPAWDNLQRVRHSQTGATDPVVYC